MRKLWSALLVLALISGMMGPVSASGDNWVKQDQISRTYTYYGHTLGKFYAVQGSPDAVEPNAPDYLKEVMPKKIEIYVTDSDYTSNGDSTKFRVSSFKKEDGDTWKTCTLGIFCTYFYPEVQVRKYEDYYVGGADSEISVSFNSGGRYISGSSESLDALDNAYKACFDAVLSLAGSPIGISWIFDSLEDKSPIVTGEGTTHLTISMKASVYPSEN